MSEANGAIYGILDEIRRGSASQAYRRKMIHPIPDAPVCVDRVKYIQDVVAGRRVLDVGCASGNLHSAIREVAPETVGIDIEPCEHPAALQYDLDAVPGNPLPFSDLAIDVIVCGEVLEHLTNPGYLLRRLVATWPNATLLVTAPNCYSVAGQTHVGRGVENVNIDHVAWYSWHTMKILLECTGWLPVEFCWYNGKPRTAEGLIFLCQAARGEAAGDSSDAVEPGTAQAQG